MYGRRSMEKQTVIIGAGLIGLSCADSLIRRGMKVSIFEAADQAGLGASQYNSGMIHPSQTIAPPGTLSALSIKSARRLISLAEKSQDMLRSRRAQLKCSDIDRPAGTIQLYDNEATQVKLSALYDQIGIANKNYDGPWAMEKPALMFPNDASGSARLFSRLLSEDIRRRGGVFHLGQSATPVIEDGRVSGIKAGKSFHPANRTIIACGAKTPELLEPLGLNIPIVPVKGHAIVFGRPDNELPSIPIMHFKSHSALTVFEDHVRLSGTLGETDSQILYKIWKRINPDMVSQLGKPLLHWSADRPVSQLARPIIAKTPIDGLFINSGHGHMGWSLCTASGELMADIITQDRMEPEFELPPRAES